MYSHEAEERPVEASLVVREGFQEEGTDRLMYGESPGDTWVYAEGVRHVKIPKLGSGGKDKIYFLSDGSAQGRKGLGSQSFISSFFCHCCCLFVCFFIALG